MYSKRQVARGIRLGAEGRGELVPGIKKHMSGQRVNQDPSIVSSALDAFQLQCIALGL